MYLRKYLAKRAVLIQLKLFGSIEIQVQHRLESWELSNDELFDSPIFNRVLVIALETNNNTSMNFIFLVKIFNFSKMNYISFNHLIENKTYLNLTSECSVYNVDSPVH